MQPLDQRIKAIKQPISPIFSILFTNHPTSFTIKRRMVYFPNSVESDP